MMFPQEKGICQQAANSSKKKKKVLHDYLDLLSSLNFSQFIIWLPNHKVYSVTVICVTSFFFLQPSLVVAGNPGVSLDLWPPSGPSGSCPACLAGPVGPLGTRPQHEGRGGALTPPLPAPLCGEAQTGPYFVLRFYLCAGFTYLISAFLCVQIFTILVIFQCLYSILS